MHAIGRYYKWNILLLTSTSLKKVVTNINEMKFCSVILKYHLTRNYFIKLCSNTELKINVK